ncbi:MAG: hypothetical protein U1E31_01785 [Rickettsiales bacterium]
MGKKGKNNKTNQSKPKETNQLESQQTSQQKALDTQQQISQSKKSDSHEINELKASGLENVDLKFQLSLKAIFLIYVNLNNRLLLISQENLVEKDKNLSILKWLINFLENIILNSINLDNKNVLLESKNQSEYYIILGFVTEHDFNCDLREIKTLCSNFFETIFDNVLNNSKYSEYHIVINNIKEQFLSDLSIEYNDQELTLIKKQTKQYFLDEISSLLSFINYNVLYEKIILEKFQFILNQFKKLKDLEILKLFIWHILIKEVNNMNEDFLNLFLNFIKTKDIEASFYQNFFNKKLLFTNNIPEISGNKLKIFLNYFINNSKSEIDVYSIIDLLLSRSVNEDFQIILDIINNIFKESNTEDKITILESICKRIIMYSYKLLLEAKETNFSLLLNLKLFDDILANNVELKKKIMPLIFDVIKDLTEHIYLLSCEKLKILLNSQILKYFSFNASNFMIIFKNINPLNSDIKKILKDSIFLTGFCTLLEKNMTTLNFNQAEYILIKLIDEEKLLIIKKIILNIISKQDNEYNIYHMDLDCFRLIFKSITKISSKDFFIKLLVSENYIYDIDSKILKKLLKYINTNQSIEFKTYEIRNIFINNINLMKSKNLKIFFKNIDQTKMKIETDNAIEIINKCLKEKCYSIKNLSIFLYYTTYIKKQLKLIDTYNIKDFLKNQIKIDFHLIKENDIKNIIQENNQNQHVKNYIPKIETDSLYYILYFLKYNCKNDQFKEENYSKNDDISKAAKKNVELSKADKDYLKTIELEINAREEIAKFDLDELFDLNKQHDDQPLDFLGDN